MSLPEQSILYVLVGILAGVSGYFTRRIQKFEETKDNSNLKVLPSLYYSLLSFKQSSDVFIQTENLAIYRASIVEILANLKNKISSGDLLPTENFDTLLIDFHQQGVILEANIGLIIDDSSPQLATHKKELLDLLKGTRTKLPLWLSVNPKKMVDDVDIINECIKKRIQKYRPFSRTVLVSILSIGAIIGIEELFRSILS